VIPFVVWDHYFSAVRFITISNNVTAVSAIGCSLIEIHAEYEAIRSMNP
jgi:hypothetical protein